MLLTPLFTSDCLEWILQQLSKAVISAIKSTHPQCELILHVLCDLTKLKNQLSSLTRMAYEWCSVICENYQSFKDWESLLLLSLEIGFRHLDPEHPLILVRLAHTDYHQRLVDVVFESKDREAIADLLCAWTLRGDPQDRPNASLALCARHLVGLNFSVPFSPRLRKLVIQSIEAISYKGFKEVEAESFVKLLNCLNVSVEDMEDEYKWMLLLLHGIQSPEGAQHLSYQSWRLLVECTILESWRLEHIDYRPDITLFLERAQEWDRLECWMGVVWMVWPPKANELEKKRELRCVMVSLFQQQPSAAQGLNQWMEQWSHGCTKEILESFQPIFEQACEIAQGSLL